MKRRNAWHLIVACGKFPVNSTVAAATGCCKQHSTARTNQANCQMQAESSRATLRDLLRTHNLRPVEQASVEPVQLATHCGSACFCCCCCCCCFLPLMLCLLCRAAHQWQLSERERERVARSVVAGPGGGLVASGSCSSKLPLTNEQMQMQPSLFFATTQTDLA